MHPVIKVRFASGYPRAAERELPIESFLQKPYQREALARKAGGPVVRDMIASSSFRGLNN
jgi:hypothetical protein